MSVFHAWIGKCHPHFVDFVFYKKVQQLVHTDAEESDVLQVLFNSHRTTFPDTGALYVQADKVLIGVYCAQARSVFAATTAKFQYYRVLVAQKSSPVSL